MALLVSGRVCRAAAVGETAFGGRIVSIAHGRAVLDYGSGPVELRLSGALQAAVAPAIHASRVPATIALERAHVQQRLVGEIPRILAETQVVPYPAQGPTEGLLVSRLPAGTLLTELGLRPGDVIASINEVPVQNMATLASLWTRFQGESTIHAVVLRGGQPVPLMVSLR